MPTTNWRPFVDNYQWQDVPVLHYKDVGDAPFKAVTRQVLFEDANLSCQLRYFEVQPGGYSTLERHEHVHAVLVLRGRGACLVGDQVYTIAEHDLITVPAMTWHQFRAADDEPLGFLCMVNCERDRPILPTAVDLENLRQSPVVAEFIRL